MNTLDEDKINEIAKGIATIMVSFNKTAEKIKTAVEEIEKTAGDSLNNLAEEVKKEPPTFFSEQAAANAKLAEGIALTTAGSQELFNGLLKQLLGVNVPKPGETTNPEKSDDCKATSSQDNI